MASPHGLDFDALQQRIHPATSRVTRLAAETPVSFVAFDLLRTAGHDLMAASQADRRTALATLLARAKPPLHLTPATRERALAGQWLRDFEGAVSTASSPRRWMRPTSPASGRC